MSEALIFASTNPQHDIILFIELQVQYMKIPSSNLGRTCCVQKLFLTFRTIFVHNMFSPCSAKRRASDKDLPVSIILSCLLWILYHRTYYLHFFSGKTQILWNSNNTYVIWGIRVVIGIQSKIAKPIVCSLCLRSIWAGCHSHS